MPTSVRHLLLTPLAAAALLLAVPPAAGAQEATARPLVRVHAPSVVRGVVEGRAERSGDTLVLSTAGGSRLRVPLSAVTRMHVRVGESRGRGALRGLAIGALSGAVAGAILPTEDCGPDGRDPDKICTRGEAVGYSAFGFGAIGAAIGALIPVGIWREASPTAVTIVPSWRDGRLAGAGMQLRIALERRR